MNLGVSSLETMQRVRFRFEFFVANFFWISSDELDSGFQVHHRKALIQYVRTIGPGSVNQRAPILTIHQLADKTVLPSADPVRLRCEGGELCRGTKRVIYEIPMYGDPSDAEQAFEDEVEAWILTDGFKFTMDNLAEPSLWWRVFSLIKR
ncbi:hypothetical protein J6590_004571 [Homalodisca vitripennis]|nr:hypothetical protein J6590_004571 [Homalodisca vitripennis]